MKNIRFKRNFVQAMATLASNIHIKNFLNGTIYKGRLKSICVPGLNCYSCPGATGACPIGAFQAVVGNGRFKFSYYITGILILIGVTAGRLVCGFLCPFGWFQDLLHKIPSRKFSTKKLKYLKFLKYAIMIIVVWLFSTLITDKLGLSAPYFCKYICPQGVLEAAIPLAIVNSGIRAALGKLFFLKFFILSAVVVLSVCVYRPFCKFICPLGAFYSIFNKISFYQYKVDEKLCINCKKCEKACLMDVDISKNETAAECIRCGKCIEVCPTAAISTSLSYSAETRKIKQ